MDLNALRNFLIIAEEQNITNAAKRLNISQPPLSRQLQNLEADLNVKLFNRSKQRISLTEEGKYLQDAARKLLAMVEKTQQNITEINQGLSGILSIGATETNSLQVLPNCMDAFRRLYPNIRYKIYGGNSEDLIKLLTESLIDIAIILEPYNLEMMEGFRILAGDTIAIMRTDHPLAQMTDKYVKTEEIIHYDLMFSTRRASQFSMNDYFVKNDYQPNIVCEFSLLLNAITLVQQNMGIAVLPSTATDIIQRYPELTYRTITSPEFPFYVSAVRRKGGYHSTIENLFWDFLHDNFSILIH